MEFNIKFDEQMMVEVANRVLDEFEYGGKTIREWADALAHPKTNADRIRAMTDEELAELMREITDPICPPNHGYKYCRDGECRKCWLDWLKEERKDG